ncbi:ABC transporter permease [Microbacterium faecale]|uniref:ABC transporter permease n=1 Tax=Microbacterium faecale TaxID=1804630 RepID=A0A917DFX1_9MICO|nr:ABC transporter permease [Microbacterium faecale]GGD34924.1 ABC transporter permease [Microbacterium faecale]
MSATAHAVVSDEQRHVAVISWKAPVIFGVFTVLFALLPLIGPREGDSTFRLVRSAAAAIQLPDLVLPSNATAWVCVVLMAASTVLAVVLTKSHRAMPLWLIAAYVAFLLIGFLSWASAGGTLPMIGLLGGALALATPLVFGALSGVIGERAGVINIAIEAQLLSGAFTGAIVGSVTKSPWAGLVGAILAGMLVGLVLAVFAITYFVSQIIVGVVLNVLVIGLTTFFFSTVMSDNPDLLNSPEVFPTIPIPLLSEIPVLGPVLFRQTIITYLMYVVVFAVSYGLYRTRWGLRLRAVGEHPQAADTVGIKVRATRYRAVMLGGAIAGMGGAFYTLVSNPQFGREMTAGAGFIALAAMIFGKWDPIRAALAALLFGFATNLQGVLSVIGSPVPSQFMLMLPYVVTLFAVAGLVGRSRPPAANGQPYIKS